MGRVTMMTAGLALATTLAGCGWQGNVAGTRQVPAFLVGCDGDMPRHQPAAGTAVMPAARWNDRNGACAGSAGSEGQPVTAGSMQQDRFATEEAALGGAPNASDDAESRVVSGTEEIAKETTGGKGGSGGLGGSLFGTGGNGGAGGSDGAGAVGGDGGAGGSGGGLFGAGGSGGAGGDGGTGGSETESGSTSETGTGGAGGAGTSGTETGGAGGSGETGSGAGGSGTGEGSQTGSGDTGGSGDTSGTGDGGTTTGPTTGETGSEPVREHTGQPVDGITGKPQEVGPPPSNGNAGGQGKGNGGRP